jgi:hypothetical protein
MPTEAAILKQIEDELKQQGKTFKQVLDKEGKA